MADHDMRSPAQKHTRGNKGALTQVEHHEGQTSARNARKLVITGVDTEDTHEGVNETEETRLTPGGFDDGVEEEFPLFPIDKMEGMGDIEHASGWVSARAEGIQAVEEELVEEEPLEGELAEDEIIKQSEYKGKGTYRRLDSFQMHQVYESGSEGGYADNLEEEGSVYNVEEISIIDEESSDPEEGFQVRTESPTYQRSHQHSTREVNFSNVNRTDEVVSTFEFLHDQDLIIVKDNTSEFDTQVNAEGSRAPTKGMASQNKKTGTHECGQVQVCRSGTPLVSIFGMLLMFTQVVPRPKIVGSHHELAPRTKSIFPPFLHSHTLTSHGTT